MKANHYIFSINEEVKYDLQHLNKDMWTILAISHVEQWRLF